MQSAKFMDESIGRETLQVLRSIAQDTAKYVDLGSERDILESMPGVVKGLSFRERSVLLPLLKSMQPERKEDWYLKARAHIALWEIVLPEAPQGRHIGWRKSRMKQ